MKKLTIGIIIGLMLGISTNAFAAIGDTVTAVFSQFVYEVNGELQTAETPVLVYEGVSYLRTTDIGNLLGYDVTYKADSRTIAFNKPEPIPEPILEPIPNPAPTSTPETTTPTETTIGTTTETTVESTTPTDTGTTEPTTPIVTPEPTTTVDTVTDTTTPEPTPVVTEPTNTAQCQQIRDSATMAVFNLEVSVTNGREYKIKMVRYYESIDLANAGC